MIGSSSSAPPLPGGMVETHQPMGGSFVQHGGDKTLSLVQKSSESLQRFQQRENYNDDLPGRYLPARRVNPNPVGIFVIDR